MNTLSYKKFSGAIVLLISVIILGLAGWNLDVVLRAVHSYQNGTLTMEKLRLDIASYNIGQPIPPIPDNARISILDGMIQIYVPAGEFIMGTGDESDGGHNSPSHIVYLDSYWFDRVEVTNSMYLKCIRTGKCTTPATDNVLYDKWAYRNHPIVYVTWFQADEYCQWAGRRLPTEAEWEKVARGTDGRMYPWGDIFPNPRLANFDLTMIHESVPSYRYPMGVSPYGALNLAGNVREWVADWFDPKYYTNSPHSNPQGPLTGFERSLRSASYNEDRREIAVYQRYKHEPLSPGLSRGFRCAQDAEPE